MALGEWRWGSGGMCDPEVEEGEKCVKHAVFFDLSGFEEISH